MGSSKRVPARKEAIQVSSKPDASDQLPSSGEHTAIQTMEAENARVTEEYIRVRAELDRETSKFQQLLQRRTMQQALSNPNAASIDRMFSMDNAGLYVHKGDRMCCFDADSPPSSSDTAQSDMRCKHELCARAASTGLSWKELDTVKWYDMRIRHEKTSRRKDALIKQRDIELVRVKQSDDEEYANTVRKFNKRETNRPTERHAPITQDGMNSHVDLEDVATVVFESRMSMMQIQKYNVFVAVRQQRIADIAKCSDIVSMALLQKTTRGYDVDGLEEQVRQAQIRSQSLQNCVERCGEKIAEAAQASKTVATWQRSDVEFDLDLDGEDPNSNEICDLVQELLMDIGMPAETIDNIGHAQSALTHVMSQSTSTLSIKVQETLDHIKEVVYKARARSDEIRASDPSAASHRPMPASSGDLRNRIIEASVKQGGSDIFENNVYSELIEIEDDVLLQFRAGYEKVHTSPVDLASFMENIKMAATAKSPVPEITEKMLDIMKTTWVDMAKGYGILRTLDELSDQVLVAQISGLVFARAEKKIAWLMAAFTAIESMLEAVSITPLDARIASALQRVQISVKARVKASREIAIAPIKPRASMPTPATTVENVSQTQIPRLTTSIEVAIGKDGPLTVHEQSIVSAIDIYTAETASRYASYLFQRKYCPGCATLRIARLFAALLANHPQLAGMIVENLSAGHPVETGDTSAFSSSTETLARELWTHTVACGIEYVTEMYHALAFDSNASSLPVPEENVALIIALVVERLRGGDNADQSLAKSFSTLHPNFVSIMKRFSEDGRFACVVFRNGTCSQHTNGTHRDESWTTQPSLSKTDALPISRPTKLVAEEIIPDDTIPPTKAIEKSNTLTTCVVPGPARRRLLPLGERYQSLGDSLEAGAKIAGMSIHHARKMSDFYILQQKAYDRAGMKLSPEAQYCIKQIKQFAYWEPGSTQAWDHHNCQCPPCVAKKDKSTNKALKFVEEVSADFDNQFEVTIDNRAVTDDELLGYSGATVERIRSISGGEATLEYLCWIAHQIGATADIAEAAGEEWTLSVQRFEDFFTYYAPIPVELELALELVKGNIWPEATCRDLFPADQWALIDDIFTFMGRISTKQLTFENGTDDWQFAESMVPEPLNIRKDRPDDINTADSSATPTNGGSTLATKRFLFAEEPQQPEREIEKQRLQLDKNVRRTEAIETQVETHIRRIDETTVPAPFPPVATEIAIKRCFNTYNQSVRPIIEYMGTIAADTFVAENDPHLEIAIRIQTPHLDCVRMIQLVAESKGWMETAAQMKEHLDNWGFQEDKDGHYPDFGVELCSAD